MAEYRRTELVSGLFVVLAIALFAGLAFKVGDFALFGRERVRFVTWLGDARLLKEGARVRMAGLVVGEVQEIALGVPGDDVPLSPGSRAERGRAAVRITFTVERDRVGPLGRADSLAIDPEESLVLLAQESLLGEWQLELVPRIVAEGGVVLFPSAEERAPIAVPGRLAGLDQEVAKLSEKLDPILQSAAEVLEKINARLLAEENLARFDQILDHATQLTFQLQASADRVLPLLDPANPNGIEQSLVAPLQRLIADSEALVRTVRTDHLPDLDARIDELLAESTRTAESYGVLARDLTGRVDGLDKEVRTTLEGAQELLGSLAETAGRLEASTAKTLDRVDGLIAKADPEVAESLSSLRRALWQAEILLRKVRANPSVILFGDDEELYEIAPGDASGLRGSGRFGPYPQRQEGGGDGQR